MRLVRRLLLSIAAGLSTLFTACAWHGPRSVDHLYAPDEVHIIGHRGARELAPENTLAGFRVPADLGYGFELDVMLSSDGVCVVIHDDELDRTTSGTGFVDEVPWSTIQTLDAGTHFATRFAGEPVPDLSTVLVEFGSKVVIDIEIKSPRDKSTRAALAAAVVGEVERAALVDRVLITSFDPFLLEEVRLANAEIRRGQLLGSFTGADLSFVEKYVLKNLLLNKRAQPDVLAAESAFLSAGYVRRMHKKGYRVLAWTVNDEAEMRELASWGVDGLITDRPDVATEVLR